MAGISKPCLKSMGLYNKQYLNVIPTVLKACEFFVPISYCDVLFFNCFHLERSTRGINHDFFICCSQNPYFFN